MPVCRHCGSRITKFDKDRCPVCGELNPLEGVSSDTIEITGQIDLNNKDFKDYRPKKRKVFLILSCLIGWLGASLFYLGYKKGGLIWLLCNLIILGGGFSIFYFGFNNLLTGILIPSIVVYLANICFGLVTFKKPSLKDAKDNLLK